MALRLYPALIHAARAAIWPLLWWLGRRVPAFRERWDERRARAPLPPAARGGIVVHAVSMGEVGAAVPLVQALRDARPDLPVVFTCTTPTASARIREAFPPASSVASGSGSGRLPDGAVGVHHVYLPFDTPGAIDRFLDALAPRLLVVLETELWPQLLTSAQARGTAVVLANGRLSERSARRYARFRGLTHEVLGALDLLLVQDADVRQRFLRLGAAPARTRVTGSLKFDTPLPAGHAAQVAQFRAWVGPRPIWIAASTHDGEEAAALAAQAVLWTRAAGQTAAGDEARPASPASDLPVQQPLLVLVPRHPQRFDDVAALLDGGGLSWQRRSEARPVSPRTAVLLADSMGELTAWMALADAVLMGGTLAPVGGHNPLEAMQFGAPLIAGPATYNFAEVFGDLDAAAAVVRIPDASALAPALSRWLIEPGGAEAARAVGARGRAVHARHGGATGRTLAPLLALLDRRAGCVEFAVGPDRVRIDPAWWPRPAGPSVHPLEPVAPFDPFDRPGAAVPGRPGSGRGTVWFVPVGERMAVLRHYRRGGVVGRVVRDRFLCGVGGRRSDSRSFAEFALLQRLIGWDLPVPRAVAARWQPAGPLWYRADIAVERLAGAEDLSVHLQAGPLSAPDWRAVGVAIARMHACGVCHADLNCHNLMRDPTGQVWIIDFDRCAVRAPGPWQAGNLARLQRSLRKERGLLAAWHWHESDWSALQAGYDAAIAEATTSDSPPQSAAA